MLPYLGGLFISVFVNIVNYWVLILMMKYICSAEINLNRKSISVCTIGAALVFGVGYLSQNDFFNFFAMFFVIALTVLLFSSRRLKDLLLFFPAFILYMLVTVMPQSLLDELHPVFTKRFQLSDFSYGYTSLIFDLALIGILIFLRNLLKKYDTIMPLRPKEILGCLGILFFCFIDIGLLMGINRIETQPVYHYIWLTILAGFFLLGVGYYLYNLIDTRVQFYRQTLTKNDTEYLKLQLETLQNSKENEEHVKRMRHDLKNHLEIINTLCEEERYEELREYTASLNKEASSLGNIIFTGNEIADMVLRSKMKLAMARNISFAFNGTLEALNKLEAPDICGLLSNAYDNALDACASLPNAYIRTKVSTTQNYTVIQITNPVAKKIHIRNNRVNTTKKEPHDHGYGMDIMRRIARKYHGECSFECTEQEFIVKIRLLT
ncbi:MAG: GHKL domain-containing protein [Lachnospiraceae bacterium]|nr:GHKL domain-containing protein [Lachnospiraceae bacterium]